MIPPPPSSTLFPYTTLFRSIFKISGKLHQHVRCPHDGDILVRPYCLHHHHGWCQPVDERLRHRESRSEEHTSELQSRPHLVCRLLLEKKNKQNKISMKIR